MKAWGALGAFCVACAAKVASEPADDPIPLPPRRVPVNAPSETGDAAATDAAAPFVFTDDFERAGGTLLGNGWFEKTDIFAIVDGGVVQSARAAFTDGIVRRPTSEATRDLEISVAFTFGAAAESDPTLYARLTPASDGPSFLQGYTFCVLRGTASIDREEGAASAMLVGEAVDPPLTNGATYRLAFRVRGADPVELEGTIAELDGTVRKKIRATDTSAGRLVAPGAFGFGSGRAELGRWDDFRRAEPR